MEIIYIVQVGVFVFRLRIREVAHCGHAADRTREWEGAIRPMTEVQGVGVEYYYEVEL